MNKSIILFFLLITMLFFSCNLFLPEEDNNAPSVTITSPTEGATLSGNALIEANASDDSSIFKVVFYADGQDIGSDNSSPYSTSWDTTSVSLGNHEIYAIAYDDSGNTKRSATINVQVQNMASVDFLETFESYAMGEVGLNGQELSNSWMASGLLNSTLSIANDPLNTGRDKTLYFNDSPDLEATIYAGVTLPGYIAGEISFDVLFTELSVLNMFFSESEQVSTHGGQLVFLDDGGIETLLYKDGGDIYELSDIPLNQWISISLTFDSATDTYSISANGVTHNNISFIHPLNLINEIVFMTGHEQGHSCKAYIDNVQFKISQSNGSGSFVLAPSNFLVEMASTTSAYLSWTDLADNEDGYNIYRFQDHANSSDLEKIAVLPANSTNYLDSGLTAGESYWYAIVAYEGTTLSDPMQDRITLLEAPTGFLVTNGTSEITLSWNAVTNADGYMIYRQSPSGEWSYIGYRSGINSTNAINSTTSPTDSTASPGVIYNYVVAAYDQPVGDNYIWAGEFSPIRQGELTSSTIPSGLDASDGLWPEHIRLNWNGVEGATSYKVYQSTSSNGTFTELGSTTTPTALIEGFTDSTARYYQVTSIVNGIESSRSLSEVGHAAIPFSLSTTSQSQNFSSPDQVHWYKLTAISSSTQVRWQDGLPSSLGSPLSGDIELIIYDDFFNVEYQYLGDNRNSGGGIKLPTCYSETFVTTVGEIFYVKTFPYQGTLGDYYIYMQ